MSAPQLISPMLDGFVMGDPISDHDGVRSCPAMHLESEQKYIVKIISLPASQSKIDALLLAGAFNDKESALSYFKDLADDVLEEAELLQKLSRYEGFVAFENWQIVPMTDDETGFDIYLLSPYQPTLEALLKSNEMTHLNAVNLGLDLCAALSVARRSGYLYSNLRPSNVYICNEREFRIGDLGFISLPSLPYASLPDKYRSDYTPPEISDAYSALNSTMDTYAVGLILYQAYNGGKLPPVGYGMEAPCYADSELSQIILKACSADPAERWQDPVQMGQALANYLQSNTVNDTPIIPVVVEEEPVMAVAEEQAQSDEPTTEDILAEVDEALEAAPVIIPTAESEPVEEEVAEAEAEEPEVAEDSSAAEVAVTDEDEIVVAAVTEEAEEAVEAEEVSEEEEPETTSAEETVEAENAEETEEAHDETAQILAQADDLIAHQLPDPVVAPEEIEVSLPTPEAEAEPEEEPSVEVEEVAEDTAAAEDTIEEEASEEEDEEDALLAKRQKRLKIFGIVAAIVLFLGVAGYLFYQHFYTQTIHAIVLKGTEDKLTVSIATEIPNEKLSVKCTDTHGNALTEDVKNGVAHFVGLKPGTSYKVEVRIDGFHRLVGETTKNYTTVSQTVIGGFYAATGTEESSVILSFTVQGPDSPQWTVTYSAEDEEEKSITFGGHMVTINGLTTGKEYTFKLQPYTTLYLSGTDTVTYVPKALVYAEQLQLVSFLNQQLTVSWATPEGITVPKWYIRCSNDAGFDQTLSTTENSIVFEGLDANGGYNIEVTAEGMTLGVRTFLSPNSIHITQIETDDSDRNNLVVKWSFEGDAPADGWLLMYSLDGSSDRQVIRCTEATGTITPLIPGAKYTIAVQPTDGTTAFNGTLEYQSPAPTIFNSYEISADDMEFDMCLTPNVTNWDRYDVKQYTQSFKVGASASFVMHVTKRTSQTSDKVVTLYVIRDAQGNVVSSKYESRSWDDMWLNRYGKLTIPVMPEEPGTYSVSVYFNGAAVTKQNFTVTA